MTGLREQIEAECAEWAERRRVAGMLTGTTAIGRSRKDRAQIEARTLAGLDAKANMEDAARSATQRDPCGRCGVRRDRHDEHGCRRWRP